MADVINITGKSVPTHESAPRRIIVPKKENAVETITPASQTTEDVDVKEAEKTLEAVAEAAEQNASENEDIIKIRDLQRAEYAGREDELISEDHMKGGDIPEGLTAAVREFPLDPSGKPIFTKDGESCPASDVDILHLDELGTKNAERFEKNFVDTATKTHEISDDAALVMLGVINDYKKDKSINVYNKLPEEIKAQVKEVCMSTNIPMSNANAVAKMMLDQMIAETETDEAFIDFETSINEAMKIPSLIDIYEEHMEDTMNNKLQAMADAIQDEDPAKAEMLRGIATRFDWARDYSQVKKEFDEVARIRKFVRRDFSNWKRFADELNFQNRDSKFRIPDATTLQPILIKVIANDSDNDITEDDVNKFITLLCTSCRNLKNDDLMDAAYIYYLLKDINMLAYINTDSSRSADTFSAELISNITALIYYIRAKEEAFNVSSKSSGKRAK